MSAAPRPTPRERLAQLVAGLAAAFPHVQVGEETVSLYVRQLEDLPYGALRKAVQDVVRTSSYFPTIAELRRRVAENAAALPSPMLAWELVADACKSGGTRGLPEPVHRAAQIVGGCWDIRHSDRPSVLRAQFLKAYEECRNEAIQDVMLGLPAGIRGVLDA